MIDVPVEVKETLQDGRRTKNYRFNVLNDDSSIDFTIDNNTLVSESVNIDERMCSGDTLKFGLCEGSSLEFQYFDHPNIKGRRIQAFIDVDYTETVIEKEYETIKEMDKYETYTIPESGRYYVYSETENNFDLVWLMQGSQYSQITPSNEGGRCFCEFDAQEGNTIEVEYPGWGFDPTYLQRVHVTKHTRDAVYTIPMGYFTAEKCSRQASTGIIKVTAYNKLQSNYLDQKANALLIDSLVYPGRGRTMFDIRYLLLNNYQITEEREAVPDSNPSSVVDSVFVNLGTFGFTQNYGIKSPINPLTLGGAGEFSLQIISEKINYHSSEGSKAMLDTAKGTLIEFEKTLVNFIKKTVNDAHLTVDGDTVIDRICSSVGFQNVVGIIHHYSFGYIFRDYYYSTVQYDYEEEHGLAHTVEGRIADIQYIVDGIYNWDAVIPDELSHDLQTVFRFSGGGTYDYYLDESMTTTGTEDNPFLTFSDGSQYQYYDDVNERYAVLLWKYTNMSSADLVTVVPNTVPDFTLRDITSAVYETLCQFGQLDRTTDLFFGAELNHSRLFPAEDLYPNNTLYPGGAAISSHRSMYSKLWGDEGDVKKWRYLIITYKGLDSQQNEKEFTLQRTVNADGNVDYNMSDNWLFKNLTWTDVQVGAYADAMVAKMQDVTWFPFEMWCPGLPYLETGDEIEVSIGQSTYSTYILQRQLKGIQNLQDTYINGTLDIF